MFSFAIFRKICYSFTQNKIFEKSKMTAKMVDMLLNNCCHINGS